MPAVRRTALTLLIAAIAVVLGILAWCGYLQLTGNIHVVEEGKAYRSAELDSAGFARVIGRYGIRSVLNLQGARPTAAWYRSELAASRTAGATHYDLRLSDSRLVTPAQIDSLLALMDSIPKPILIHCKAGADRSGLVSALYLWKFDSLPPDRAAGQLSLAYGHFPWLGSRTVAMDRSYWQFIRLDSTRSRAPRPSP